MPRKTVRRGILKPRIYKPRPLFRKVIFTVAVVLLVLLAVSLILFFVLRSFAVYLPDGTVEIRLPWVRYEQTIK